MEYLLRMENIEKSFPGVQVLKNISMKTAPNLCVWKKYYF